MKEQWYGITDLDMFVESTRTMVFSSFGPKEDKTVDINMSFDSLSEEEKKEIDMCLSKQESDVILKDFIKFDKRTQQYAINDKNYYKFIEALNSRMVSNILNKLTRDGFLESAFDTESNDFIFWVKEE